MRSFFLCLTNNFFLLESKNLVFLDFCVVRICFLTYTFFTLRQVLSNFQRSIFIINSHYNKAEIMVGLNGLEPSTSRLSGVRSNQLSYRPI